jgi:hypothetical protein
MKVILRLGVAVLAALGLLAGALSPATARAEVSLSNPAVVALSTAPSSYYREAVRTAKSYCRSIYMRGSWRQSVRRSSTYNNNSEGWQFSATVSGTFKNSTLWERKQISITVQRNNGRWDSTVL